MLLFSAIAVVKEDQSCKIYFLNTHKKMLLSLNEFLFLFIQNFAVLLKNKNKTISEIRFSFQYYDNTPQPKFALNY